ncbi:MAG: hypothetical protein KDD42_05930 [Bdellovibrionales bacterium]|nr:hypothetical protein [Bdellovibrionales bacterium]
MGYEDFISENEATTIAGVTARTLMRFAEAGYLQTECDNDGLRLYAKSEVQELFGVMDENFYEQLADDLHHNRAEVVDAPLDSNTSESQQEFPSMEHNLEVSDQNNPDPESTTHLANEIPDDQITLEKKSELEHVLRRNEIEISRLRTLVDLQERLLDAKEQQVREISEERDWLRNRIEKLEQKGERDQFLLLSSNHTIRRMISMQEQRRSPIRSALEWIGLVQPRGTTAVEPLGMTIDSEQPAKASNG